MFANNDTGGGNTPIDLSNYATKQELNDAISKVPTIKGEKGDKGEQGIPGRDGVDGKDGLTTSVNGVSHVNGNITLTANNIGAYEYGINDDSNDNTSTLNCYIGEKRVIAVQVGNINIKNIIIF